MEKGAVKSEILPVVDDPRKGQARLSFESLDSAALATLLPDPGEHFDRSATTLRLQLILAHTSRGVLVTEWPSRRLAALGGGYLPLTDEGFEVTKFLDR
jgi:hypothetical protein